MIYQSPNVGSSKENCRDRIPVIKSLEVEVHKLPTMSSHEKLKGFKNAKH